MARRARTLVGAAVVAVVALIGVGSYAFVRHLRVQQAELKSEEDRRAAEAEANRKLEEAGKQRRQRSRSVRQEQWPRPKLSARVRKPSNSE